MIRAELQGKYVREALNSEDYLTSNVFSVLRFQSLSAFWFPLLERAWSAASPLGNLLERFRSDGLLLDRYSRVDVRFWIQTKFGEPDLEIVFRGEGVPDLRILIEAKFLSGKSSTSCEDDQLRRYLGILLEDAEEGIRDCSHSALIYLTVRSAHEEVQATLQCFDCDELRPCKAQACKMLYMLHWQDIAETAHACLNSCTPENRLKPEYVMLQEALQYLVMRDLQPFRGMRPPEWQYVPIQGLQSRPLFARLQNFPAIQIRGLFGGSIHG